MGKCRKSGSRRDGVYVLNMGGVVDEMVFKICKRKKANLERGRGIGMG